MMTLDAAFRESHFYLTETAREHPLMEISWNELGSADSAVRFYDAYRKVLGAEDLDVAATYFASLLGGLCGGFHYYALLENTELVLDPATSKLQLFGTDSRPQMLVVHDSAFNRAIPATDGVEGVKSAMGRFYGNSIRPVLESAAAATGERVLNLWRLLATRLVYTEDYFAEHSGVGESERIRGHFEMVRKELSPERFGRKSNPLDFEFCMIEDPRNPDRFMRQRGACCLAYKTAGDHGLCYSCPRLSEAERMKRREEMKAAR